MQTPWLGAPRRLAQLIADWFGRKIGSECNMRLDSPSPPPSPRGEGERWSQPYAKWQFMVPMQFRIIQGARGSASLPTGAGRGPAAFTLIELILVMAMLIIVMAVSAPALAKFFRGRALDSEARRFVSLTRYGQSRAVSEGVPMVLWLDTKQGTYGLHREPGYADEDRKELELELGKDLEFEILDVPARSGQLGTSRQTARNLPTIRFLPDGFISEISPQSIWIREGTNEVWITQNRNRLNYEIQTNRLAGNYP